MRYTRFDPDLNRFVVPCLFKADGEQITFNVKEEPAEFLECENLRGETLKVRITPPMPIVWGEVIDRLAELENEKDVTDINVGNKSGWISVYERLPKNGLARVLVFLRDNDFTKPIGFNKIDTDRFIDGRWVRWGDNVSHWMPIPEPPKEEKK